MKLLNPFSVSKSATLLPSAFRGLALVWAERALAAADPPTLGSIKGVMPRRRALAGRDGSLQMVGISWTNGLKFFSAATIPIAAATASAPVPSSARIWSPRFSLSQALAPASKSLMAAPAMVAAAPGAPPLTAEMAPIGTCSWLKRA